MKAATFRQRLEAGKSVSYLYHTEDKAGVINLWRYGGQFVLTWEECRDGDQYNEQNYTRDETLRFDTLEAVEAFLAQNALLPEHFTP